MSSSLGSEHFSDPAIWEQIDKGHTTGIFQVSTPNCTAAAMDFNPRSEVDIADLTSIIRPGVADAGLKEVYLRRRAGKEPVVYDHPLMEKFVGPSWKSNTYGMIVYQEQIIEIVQELAGFSPDEADDIRKAVGKKYLDKVLAFKGKFVEGCVSNLDFIQSIDTARARQIANKIWLSIESAARYAFNWSHAVEYAHISTPEVWVKYYYPQEFLVALMQTDANKTNDYIREARRRECRYSSSGHQSLRQQVHHQRRGHPLRAWTVCTGWELRPPGTSSPTGPTPACRTISPALRRGPTKGWPPT